MSLGIKFDLISDFIQKQLGVEFCLTDIIKEPYVYHRDKHNKLYYIISTKSEMKENLEISLELAYVETGNIHQILIYNDESVDSLRIYWTILDKNRNTLMGSIYFLTETNDFYLSRTFVINREKAELIYHEYPINSNIVQQTMYFDSEGIKEFKAYGIVKDTVKPETIYFNSLAYYFDVYECDKSVILEKGEGIFIKRKSEGFVTLKASKNRKSFFNRRDFKLDINSLVRKDIQEFLADNLKELNELL